MISSKKIVILYHIFYEDTIHYIVDQLRHLHTRETLFYFNISEDNPSYPDIRKVLLDSFPGSYITISSNKGKDIGGKLLLIAACLHMNIEPEWFLILHDKKSLQAFSANEWKAELFKIAEPANIDVVNKIISSLDTCGIVAAKKYVLREPENDGKFTGLNGPILDKLLQTYKIKCDHRQYVAGTMFWAKASPLFIFFRKHDPLNIRQTLETGNVIDDFAGTYTHSWERMLSWIITSSGLTIKTI